MRCRLPLVLCALLFGALLVGAVPAVASPDVEETHMEVQIQEDGDARWTVVASVPLEDDDEVDAFESFADDFEDGDTDLDLGLAAFETAAEEASAASGRQMGLRSTARDSAVVEETTDEGETVHRGELRLSFTWTSFARSGDDGQIVVDDAFNTSDGTWMQGLDRGQSLTIKSPPGHGATSAPIGLDGGELHWEGPQEFEPGDLQIVYSPSPFPNLSTFLLAGALLLSAAALLLGLYLLWRRQDVIGAPSSDDEEERPEPAGDTGPDQPVPGTGSPATDGDGGTDVGVVEEPDLELLSDEERVEYLLEQNGGRMKQASIVEETGWSNAKVSQLLSAMEEEDRIDKLRIGRENLISLPGEGVADIDSGDER